MSKAVAVPKNQTRATISLIAGVLVGIIFVVSGSGKIFAYGEMPGQTMQFIGAVLPDAWLTPQLAVFLGQIFFPYIIPWLELCLGIMLLLRIWPRLFATITLPLIAAFMANNIWYINKGDVKFTECDCFGIWKMFLGSFTHVESLYIDIVLLALALTVIFIHPGGFLSSPTWLARLGRGTRIGGKKDTQ